MHPLTAAIQARRVRAWALGWASAAAGAATEMLLPAIANFSLHARRCQGGPGRSQSSKGAHQARQAERYKTQHGHEHWQDQAVLIVIWRENHHRQKMNGDERVD